jgi:hypothetical protein
MPARVEGERPQDQIGMAAGMFGQAHLRAEHRPVYHVEDVHRCDRVDRPPE